MAQLGARLDGIEEVVGSNPIGSTSFLSHAFAGSRTIAKTRPEDGEFMSGPGNKAGLAGV